MRYKLTKGERRERRRHKGQHGMVVTGRSTKTVLLPVLMQQTNRQQAEADRMARAKGKRK